MIHVKRVIFLLIVSWYSIQLCSGQQQKIADSLSKIYQSGNFSDSERKELLLQLSFNEISDLPKGIAYADELIRLSLETGDRNNLRVGYFLKGNKYRLVPRLDDALEAYFKCAEISRETGNRKGEGEAYGAVGDVYAVANNFENAYTYYQKAIGTLKGQEGAQISLASVLLNTGELFRNSSKQDSALLYFREAKSIFEQAGDKTGIFYSVGNIGMVYAALGSTRLAEENINKAVEVLEEAKDYYPICEYLISIAGIFEKKGEHNKALDYARRSLQLAEQVGLMDQISKASLQLAEWYEKEGNDRDAFYYYKKHITFRDSIKGLETLQKMYDLRINYVESQKQIEVNLLNQQKRNQRILLFSLAIILALAVVILFILYRSNQHKRKAVVVLKRQKQETDLQRAKAEDALNELKLTQKQLIQSAKMASLGELTAGIAHEMKNPLNFVNNFSEVSIDLLDELKGRVLTNMPDADKDDVEGIVNDLETNLNKILQHGRRADDIVKGMLQHSGHTSGEKELIDINALADEYIRLSYHGLNAREKGLVSKITTEFDPAPGQIEAVPQDIGRVLLNLFQNAYYAVIKKKDASPEGYEPEIRVTTRKTAQGIEVRVRDNGTGIAGKNLEKIFQPFFTTKPAGQGTGLGLSLCHDIIEAHGGSISVDSREGEYTEFVIVLPAAR